MGPVDARLEISYSFVRILRIRGSASSLWRIIFRGGRLEPGNILQFYTHFGDPGVGKFTVAYIFLGAAVSALEYLTVLYAF